MYSLAEFSLQDMTACSAKLRMLGAGAASMEEGAHRLVRYLYEYLVDGQTRKPACALVRLFKTREYGALPSDYQVFAQKALGTDAASPEMKCLTLFATAGERPEWNHPEYSHRYKAIPLMSADFVAQFPMFSQLFIQLGMNLDTALGACSPLLIDAKEHAFNVFYVPDAIGSPFVPVQQEFVIPYGVRSVVGFGGLLPSGDLFVVVLFSKVFLSRQTADRFKTLALSAKLALLPFDGGPIDGDLSETARNGLPQSRQRESQIAALEQLLALHEEAVITYAAQRRHVEEALLDSEARLSAVVESTNDVVLSVDSHGLIKSWNKTAQTQFGYAVQEIYGKPGAVIIPRFDAAFQQAVETASKEPMLQVTGATCEALGRRKDGSTFPVELSLASWSTKNGLLFLDTIRDMTERKRVEAALEQSESRLRNLIDHAPAVVFTLSRQGVITSLNPLFES